MACTPSQNKMLPWLRGGEKRLSVWDMSRSGLTADNVWLNSCLEAGWLVVVCSWDPWCDVQVVRCLPLAQHSQQLQHVTRRHPQISHPVLIVLGSTQTQLEKSACARMMYSVYMQELEHWVLIWIDLCLFESFLSVSFHHVLSHVEHPSQHSFYFTKDNLK